MTHKHEYEGDEKENCFYCKTCGKHTTNPEKKEVNQMKCEYCEHEQETNAKEKKKKKTARYDPLGVASIFGVEEEVDYSEESEDDDEVVF